MKNSKEKMIRAIQVELNMGEFKKTVTSLDNLFVGSMVVASAMFLNWLWMALGWWLVILPLGYLGVCYLGKILRGEYVKFQERKKVKSRDWNYAIYEFSDEDGI